MKYRISDSLENGIRNNIKKGHIQRLKPFVCGKQNLFMLCLVTIDL